MTPPAKLEPGPDGRWYLRYGPFRDAAAAEHVAETIQELVRAGVSIEQSDRQPLPPSVEAAVRRGESMLEAQPGHYVLRVDGAPGGRRKVSSTVVNG